MSSPASRIVIIGAGIGGLTLALLLRCRGIIAKVLEQVPEPRYSAAARPGARQFKAMARAVRDVDEDEKGTTSGRYHALVPARTMM
jgi:2-polyprenyl-6-methoxyphenol hydroxylase-like FAD-dependent oxidoreductase